MAATSCIRKRKKKHKRPKPNKARSLKKHTIPFGKEKINGQWVGRFSDELFARMTKSERFFYQIACRERIGFCDLHPQFPLYGYIADFYCVKHRVVVELDGGYHHNSEQKKYDEKRDDFLREQGICVVRFANSFDESQVESYLYKIKQICKLRQTISSDKRTDAPVTAMRKA